jgi:hypothetical protein
MTQTTEERLVSWSWRFTSPEAMREQGLEQYTEFLEGRRTSAYDAERGDEGDGKAETCAIRKRHEIDRCMDGLEYPFLYRLLDLYYRQGQSCEQHGWCEVAKKLGLRGDAKSRWDKDTFEVQVTLAIGRLFRVHEGRYGRKS